MTFGFVPRIVDAVSRLKYHFLRLTYPLDTDFYIEPLPTINAAIAFLEKHPFWVGRNPSKLLIRYMGEFDSFHLYVDDHDHTIFAMCLSCRWGRLRDHYTFTSISGKPLSVLASREEREAWGAVLSSLRRIRDLHRHLDGIDTEYVDGISIETGVDNGTLVTRVKLMTTLDDKDYTWLNIEARARLCNNGTCRGCIPLFEAYFKFLRNLEIDAHLDDILSLDTELFSRSVTRLVKLIDPYVALLRAFWASNGTAELGDLVVDCRGKHCTIGVREAQSCVNGLHDLLACAADSLDENLPTILSYMMPRISAHLLLGA